MIDPLKNFATAADFYEMLREFNPQLPETTYVTRQPTVVTFGPDNVATIQLEVFITVPTMEMIESAIYVSSEATQEQFQHLNESEQTDEQH